MREPLVLGRPPGELVSILFEGAKGVGVKIGMEELTTRFKSPTNRPSKISRASSLCPTSSNASVASCPPTSSRTSSPPLRKS